MTMQVSKTIGTSDKVAPDAPMFDTDAFRLDDEQAGIVTRGRELGQTVFAGRAADTAGVAGEGARESQPAAEGGAAAAGGVAVGTGATPVDGGWVVNGKKIFASLSGHADYYGVLCTEVGECEKASRRNTLHLA